jgi:hypothetical protein
MTEALIKIALRGVLKRIFPKSAKKIFFSYGKEINKGGSIITDEKGEEHWQEFSLTEKELAKIEKINLQSITGEWDGEKGKITLNSDKVIQF